MISKPILKMPKRNLANPNKYHIWFSLLIFLIGLALGYFLQIPNINFDNSISLPVNPTNILSVLATIVVAFYLANDSGEDFVKEFIWCLPDVVIVDLDCHFQNIFLIFVS